MSICYQGTTGFTLQAEQPVTESGDGKVTSSRRYLGDGSERAEFLTQWPIGQSHPTDGRLTVSSRTYDDRDAGPVFVTISFSGLDDGAGSDGGDTITDGSAGKTIRSEMLEREAKITKNSTGDEYAITYACPTRYVEWYKRADQKTPAKEGSSGINDFSSIVIKTAARAVKDGAALANPNTFFVLDTDYTLEAMGTIEGEPNGDVWRLIETWQLIVADKL